MVTDEQYRALQKRIDELECRLTLLSQNYSKLLMKGDIPRSASTVSPDRQPQKSRDTTRYIFCNETLCKRNLVLACVKKYVADNPSVTGNQLEEIFPDYVQGSLGVIRSMTEAERYNRAKDRFFFADNDVLHRSDGAYVVCAQWDKDNIDAFIRLANDLGYQIDVKQKKYRKEQ